jgi:hypothetical protein
MAQKEKNTQSKPTNMNIVMAYIKYFLEHFEDLILSGTNSIMKAQYFGVLFDIAPNYQEILSGTPKIAEIIELNKDYAMSQNQLVNPKKMEPS